MMGSAARAEAPPDPAAAAARLIALAQDCIAARVARRALLLLLSALPAAFARPTHLRLARAALDPLRLVGRVQEFVLPNGDLALVWRGAADAAVAASMAALARLFADAGEGAPDPLALCRLLDLPADAGTLLHFVETSLRPATAPALAQTRRALDAVALAALEEALARADVARFVRRRPICAATAAGGFRKLWEKRFLSIEELAGVLAPGQAVAADPWLFRRLTRVLDRRMLALLAAPGELAGAGPFSLNLNVASILAPEFLRFDAALPSGLRRQVTLDLLPADILADPPAFLFARDFVRARGYRLLLRGVGVDLLEAAPLDRMGLDLLQLRWSPGLAETDPDWLGAPPERLVLARAASASAVGWGRLRGISLFQGVAAVPGGRG